MSSKFKPSHDDWFCSDPKCGNVNFARRDKCNKCGSAKGGEKVVKPGGIEIGKQMAEKSKGLFSAEDWQCKTCGNVNWARRNTCNVCYAPRFGKVESRTGYGGGFMERDQVVEYKEKVESDDDEFDEFGRKKKKYRGSNSGEGDVPKPSTKGKEESEEEDNEEEEEDDDDDADLSKYNLEEEDEEDDNEDVSKYEFSDLDDDDGDDKDQGKKRRHSSSSSSSSSRSSGSRSNDSYSNKRRRRRSSSSSDS